MATATKAVDNKIQGVMDALTANVIESIEAGIADPKGWKAPWHTILAGSVNATTKRQYQGGNAMLLGFLGEGPWATFNQWKDAGAMVRKGSKGVPILVPVPVKFTKADKNGDDKTVSFTRYRVAYVFSADSVDGWNAPESPTNNEPRIADADAWIAAWSKVVPINHIPGNQAYYRRDIDAITLPPFDQFKDSVGFYNTVFHEAGHSTGHDSRLDRAMGDGFGSPTYAREELVAELTAAFMGRHFNIQTESVTHDGHADYLASWLGALRNDTNLLWNAASDAQRAVKLLLSVVPDTDAA